MSGTAFLRGERVSMRAVEASDLPFVRRLVNEPAVRETLGSVLPYNGRQQSEWFESLTPDDFTFLVGHDGEAVGLAELADYFPQWGVAEVRGYVAPEHWGRGYATETLGLLCAYAFDTLGLHRLRATALATNGASQRVLERNGFTKEGVDREGAFYHGERVDVLRFGLLASEWRDPNTTDERRG